MEKNELIGYRPDVTFGKAPVLFTNFETVKAQALDVADFVSSIVVTEDTIQAAKKMVAETRKSVKALDSRRLEIKRQILEDYDRFEGQVKELKTIVDDADQVVRRQIKVLEEQERERRKERLKGIFGKRYRQYDIGIFLETDIAFEKWIESNPTVLNKSVTISKGESQLTEWLEAVQKDIELIRTMSERDDIYVEYFKNLDAVQAIKTVKENAERKQMVLKSTAELDDLNGSELDALEQKWQSISVFCTSEELKRAKNILISAGFDVAREREN